MSYSHPGRLHERFAEAVAAQDIERLLGFHEADAVSVARDGTPVSGRDALRSPFTGALTGPSAPSGCRRPR